MYLGMAAPVRLVAEPWTLITSMFLHAPNSLLHILFNMIALYSVGPVLERMIGHWRFLGLYVISGLGGSLGLMVWAAVAPGGIGWQMAAYGALEPYLACLHHCWWYIAVSAPISAPC